MSLAACRGSHRFTVRSNEIWTRPTAKSFAQKLQPKHPVTTQRRRVSRVLPASSVTRMRSGARTVPPAPPALGTQCGSAPCTGCHSSSPHVSVQLAWAVRRAIAASCQRPATHETSTEETTPPPVSVAQPASRRTPGAPPSPPGRSAVHSSSSMPPVGASPSVGAGSSFRPGWRWEGSTPWSERILTVSCCTSAQPPRGSTPRRIANLLAR